MCLSFSRAKLTKISALIVVFRNFTLLAISWVILFIKRQQTDATYYWLGKCVDVYILISFFGICKLFEGLKHVRNFYNGHKFYVINIPKFKHDPKNFWIFIWDMVISCLLMSGLIAFQVVICVKSIEYDEFHHFYMPMVMSILAVFVITNLVVFSIVRNAKKRITFFIEQENRTIITPNDAILSQQQEQSVYDAAFEETQRSENSFYC